MTLQTRTTSFFVCIGAYIASFALAVFLMAITGSLHPIMQLLIMDIGATIVVFVFSVLFNNSSIYDPYWSVIPIGIVFFYLFESGDLNSLSPRQMIVLGLVCLWGLRLTINWVRGWQGLKHEDWRYVRFRDNYGKLYWPLSFFGIHLFPTLVVFAGCLPLFVSLTLGGNSIGIVDIIAFLFTLGAIIVEMTADKQLRRFAGKKDRNPGDVIQTGLWKSSRHPNYFGEVFFWIGMYLFSLAVEPGLWWPILGPVSMVCLFLFISIPMMERRLSASRGEIYLEYRKRTSSFLPWFPKK
jgi:steroid 5-alpha reductase family enzyme